MSSQSNSVARQNLAIVGIGTVGLWAWTSFAYDMITVPLANAVPALGFLSGGGNVATAAKWISGGSLLLIGSEFSALQYV